MALTPLELPGWLEFNERRTKLKAQRIVSAEAGAEARAVVYMDRRGRISQPPNNPYLPVTFTSSRMRPSSRTADWLRVVAPLVEEMRRRGVGNLVTLPPAIDDPRPWRWRGFQVGVRFTTSLDLPYDPANADQGTRRNCDKAAKLGMTAERVDDVAPVASCLADTAARAGFALGIGAEELRLASSLLGPDSLRMYACFDADGQPASACVILHEPGAQALWWQSGTSSSHLGDGASHLLWKAAFEDLATAGAAGLDGCGANIRSVADFKTRWGARLVPTYTVRTFTSRTAARFAADWIASVRGHG